MSKICAFTSICEEDKEWIDSYLDEVRRLQMPFMIHFDRCSEETKRELINTKYCHGWSEQNDHKVEFTEQHKQKAFDLVVDRDYQWAMAWDIDETWEKNIDHDLEEIPRLKVDYVTTNWINVWNDSSKIRIDGSFGVGKRVKFYNLHGRRWRFDHPITNGCKLVDIDGKPLDNTTGIHYPLTCLHWGLMTKELRLQHKERWDRIYSTAVGSNPYGFWNLALDESITPVLVNNRYL
jgi:hypothetical protein